MKFKIETTWIQDPNKIIEEYPCLKDFGFMIEPIERPVMSYVRDENGKKTRFEKTETVDRAFVEIKDLDDLWRLREATKNPLVIGDGGEKIIEIYDGYRE